MNTDAYISEVIARLPHEAALRSQVAMELRSHIAERVEHGDPEEEALRQLGDPVVLADSYLAAVPLVPASFWRRAAAKTIDCVGLIAVYLPVAWIAARLIPAEIVILLALVSFGVIFCLYLFIAEYAYGKTIGKHLLGLRVVRESGGGISRGQAFVRQLPIFFQFYWIDVMFALFTDRRQRAFELLSKTRVVVAPEAGS
jgi:uncharacterized RDD family membrane protein YckC